MNTTCDYLQKILDSDCYVIAEAGLNHNGCINLAKQLIDVASNAGANAVKFQKRTVDVLATPDTLDAVDTRFPEFGNTYREIRDHLEFDGNEYREIKAYCQSKSIDFLCTAFDTEAVDFLEEIGVPGYKLASHSLTNLPLLDYISQFGKLCILSTGMCTFEEIKEAKSIFERNNCPLILLHCVSSYPTPNEDSNIKMMDELKTRFKLPVGYSGHEIGFIPTITAVARGAVIVERHFTLDKTMTGFDHKISLEPRELSEMIEQIRYVRESIGGISKSVSEKEQITRNKYHVSMVAKSALRKGDVLHESNIEYRNPGTGINPSNAKRVLGKILRINVTAGSLITEEMF